MDNFRAIVGTSDKGLTVKLLELQFVNCALKMFLRTKSEKLQNKIILFLKCL